MIPVLDAPCFAYHALHEECEGESALEEERSFLHTLILGVCVIICAILIARMAFDQPVPYFVPHRVTGPTTQDNPNDVLQLRLTEGELSGMIDDGLPEGSPITDITLAIGEQGRVELAATLSRERLQNFLPAQTVPRSLLALLPESCEMEATMCVEWNDGLHLRSVSASAAGVTLPEAAVEALAERAAQEITVLLARQGIAVGAIETMPGALQITLP